MRKRLWEGVGGGWEITKKKESENGGPWIRLKRRWVEQSSNGNVPAKMGAGWAGKDGGWENRRKLVKWHKWERMRRKASIKSKEPLNKCSANVKFPDYVQTDTSTIERQNKGLHQLFAGRHGHQIDALQLSGVGQNSLGAGGQDVVARRRHLATLRKKTITHEWSGKQAQGWRERAHSPRRWCPSPFHRQWNPAGWAQDDRI